MELKNVEIKNFKGIENCFIDLKPGINLLIGNNGYGKTSILEALSVCLGGFIAGIGEIKTRHFTKDEIRIIYENMGDGSYDKKYMTPVAVKCDAEIEKELFTWTRSKSSLNASRSTVEPRDVCRKAFSMANEGKHILPILSYQSCARVWMQKREAAEDIFAGTFYRTVGYAGCLAEASNTKMMMNWVRRMEKMEWKNKKTIREYQAVKHILCRFMEIMSQESGFILEYDDRSDCLIFEIGEKALPIENLSSGYQSLIWMVLDIAFRMAILNPDLYENISEVPGVILIDEIDVHLHPKWQWNVLRALKETFPNVQFIVATHSPIVIASCKNENLIAINREGEMDYFDTPYGLDVSETLDIFQESLPIAKEVSNLLREFYQLIDEEKLEKAEDKLQELKLAVGDNNPKVVSAETTLELEKMPLED
ncbi:AAA family ATPase [Blautia producta]|uniref:AAA family ATPase n=1 Tax=Blautia producta TaxID=33035 RepID=UPI0031B5C9C1